MLKKCHLCLTEKPITEFHRNKGRKDGYDDRCKVCLSARMKVYHLANREEVKKRDHDRYARNP